MSKSNIVDKKEIVTVGMIDDWWRSRQIKLSEVFDESDVSWRVVRTSAFKPMAMVVAFLDNRAIMNRLDEVFGIGGWVNDFKPGVDGGVLCGIGVFDPFRKEYVWKWDGAENTEIEAVKGGISDAMKRAGYQWGIGRYLYKLDETKVALKTSGEFYIKYKDKYGKMSYLYWDKPKLPEWARKK